MGDTTPRGYRMPQSTDDPVNLTSFWRNMATDIDADVTALALSRGIPVAPVTTSSNGTATSGSTELKDSALGDYTFTAVGGVRYRVVLSGRGIFGSVVADRFAVNFRDGGAGSPNTSSTLIGENSTIVVPATGSNGVQSATFTTTWIPGAGTHKIAVFYKLLAGTGTATPTGNAEFYVEAIGTH